MPNDPPENKSRSKIVNYSPDIVSIHVGSHGIPARYGNHRKSSIPFNDRCPKVRFLRSVQPHGVNDSGSHVPIVVAATEGLKPILKKTEFPILIDICALESTFFLRDGCCTNDALEGCTNCVEQIIQFYSKADREARGTLDILTFPISTGTIEALSRFEGSMVIALLGIYKLKKEEENPDKQLKGIVTKLLEELMADITHGQERAHDLLVKSKGRYKQWTNLLSKKGEFQVEIMASKVPIYTKNSMRESVTLYEDVMEEKKRYRYNGSTKIYRSTNDVRLVLDIKDHVVMKYADDVNDDQSEVIIETVLEHAKDLVVHAGLNLDLALKTLSHKIFDVGYTTVKEKIINIEFDAFFDPLCALELKTALGDIVSRKGDLLNTAEHIVFYFKWMEKFTKVLMKYCRQNSSLKKEDDSETKGGCCGLGKPVTKDMLLDLLNGLGHTDFMITIPLTERFERAIFEIEPEQRDEKVNEPELDKSRDALVQ